MTNIRVKVVSDTVCPWCYVGRRQLQAAERLWKAQHPADTFSVSYEPYQLRPDWPRGPSSSRDKQQMYIEKFGEQRVAMMRKHLGSVGESLGINFKHGGRTGNTFDSHRLVHVSKKHGDEVHGKVIDGLFAAYFENEKDITDYAVLREVAVQSGISAEEFDRDIANGNAGEKEVELKVKEAQDNGVTGVPDFTIQDRFSMSGARQPEDFFAVFERVKKMEEAAKA